MYELKPIKMATLPFDKYDEDFTLDFEKYDEITYADYGENHVDVFHKGNLVAELLVYTDHENGGREYVCINHEVIYLDTLSKQLT
jgi:hypothetical protein